MQEETERKDSFYNPACREMLHDNDEITDSEECFMKGYEEAM